MMQIEMRQGWTLHLGKESRGVDFPLSRESRGCRAEVGSARPR